MRILIFAFISCIFFSPNLFAQKTISEGTLVYSMSIQTPGSEPKMADMLDGATIQSILRAIKAGAK